MKEESQHPQIEPGLEARIVALVLGEASDFEREELDRLIDERPELAVLRKRIATVHEMLGEVATGERAVDDDDWKLPDEMRTAVLAVIDGEAEIGGGADVTSAENVAKKSVEKRSSTNGSFYWNISKIAAVLCVMGLIGSLALPTSRKPARTANNMNSLSSSSLAVSNDSEGAAKPSSSRGGPAQPSPYYMSDDVDLLQSTVDTPAHAKSDYEADSKSALSAIQSSLGRYAGTSTEAEGVREQRSWGFAGEPGLTARGPQRDYASAATEAMNSPEPQPQENAGEPGVGLRGLVTDSYATRSESSRSFGHRPKYAKPSLGSGSGVQSFPSQSDSSGNSVASAPVAPTARVAPPAYPSAAYGESTAVESTAPIAPTAPPSNALSQVEGSAIRSSRLGAVNESMAETRFGQQAEGRGQTADSGSEAIGARVDKLRASRRIEMAQQSAPTFGRDLERRKSERSANSFSGPEPTEGTKSSLEQLAARPDSDYVPDSSHLAGAQSAGKAVDGIVSEEKSLPGIIISDDEVLGSGIGTDGMRADRDGSEVSAGRKRVDNVPRAGVPFSVGNAAERSSETEPASRMFGGAGFGGGGGGRGGGLGGGGGGGNMQAGEKEFDTDVLARTAKARPVPADERMSFGLFFDREKKPEVAEQELEELSEVDRVGRNAVHTGLDEKTAEDEAFSTFSLHVSDVAFKLAKAALAKGEWPDAAKVRIEEFVNAFDYGDPLPSQIEKVACRLEQAIHPFLQQRNLLRVSIRTAATGRSSSTPLRLTFLLDNSGSMERIDRQQTVRRAFDLLTQQLKPIDQVTLISFARQPRLLADKVSGAESHQLVELIGDLPSDGGTNLEAALQLAFEKAQEQQADHAQNRIVLLTDGAANLGDADPASLSRLIETMRSAGIAFDAAGISADGLNDEILEALTRRGDGRYYLLDRREDVDDGFARQIAGALRPAAKNVKVQIEFNPQRVGRYKLLGFEKHRLKKEDFRNDKVDAAEMAAAEAGVALYQFEAKPDGEGDVGSVSVRFRDMTTGQMVEKRWPIPYEADAPHVDQAAPPVRIATAAALFGAKLRGEPLGETVDLKTLSNLLAGLPERHRNARRVQQLQQMIHQARQLIGE